MLKIRKAIQSDAAAILQVHRAAVFLKAAGYYDQAQLELWSPGATPERVSRIQDQIAQPHFVVLVADIEDEIIGYAMAHPVQNRLRALYVKPNSVGHVGRMLLAEMEQIAVSAGADFFALDASLNAETFYKANGYAEVGRILLLPLLLDAIQMKKQFRTINFQPVHSG